MLADMQAVLSGTQTPDLVWVPCFRQRDLEPAVRWAHFRRNPIIFDPLISAYDKQVDERRKFPADSPKAKRLLAWERKLFSLPDRLVADTAAHADYFHDVLGVPREKISVLMVGAEEELFQACPARPVNEPLDVLFYGSFIPLQGPEVIVEAARLCTARNVTWTLLGDGPLRPHCEQLAEGLDNVRFEDWLPYDQLPGRICQADIVLGIFGDTPKAGRVIPNKVYQALACGRALVTRRSEAYPRGLSEELNSGISWVAPSDPQSLAAKVQDITENRTELQELQAWAGETYSRSFSNAHLSKQLTDFLEGV